VLASVELSVDAINSVVSPVVLAEATELGSAKSVVEVLLAKLREAEDVCEDVLDGVILVVIGSTSSTSVVEELVWTALDDDDGADELREMEVSFVEKVVDSSASVVEELLEKIVETDDVCDCVLDSVYLGVKEVEMLLGEAERVDGKVELVVEGLELGRRNPTIRMGSIISPRVGFRSPRPLSFTQTSTVHDIASGDWEINAPVPSLDVLYSDQVA
jgi:hypothetical protein